MLNATEYEVLAMFADGADPATISDDLGMPLMSVGFILNDKANRKRTVARELINQQKPPALVAAKRADSPLTAPIAKPTKDRAKEVPERLREEPVPAGVTYGNSTQSVDTKSPLRTAIQVMGDVIRDPAKPYDPYALAAISLAEQASTGAIIVPADDLTTMDGLHLAALDIPDLRDAAIALGNQAAELRSKVVEHRRQAAVKARIAELEAELAQLREMAA